MFSLYFTWYCFLNISSPKHMVISYYLYLVTLHKTCSHPTSLQKRNNNRDCHVRFNFPFVPVNTINKTRCRPLEPNFFQRTFVIMERRWMAATCPPSLAHSPRLHAMGYLPSAFGHSHVSNFAASRKSVRFFVPNHRSFALSLPWCGSSGDK